jgi:phosphatidylglycerol:prolipoprotein diacylglycerol transferase
MSSIFAFTVNGHWVHDLSKFVPLLPHTETIGVRYYGLAYVLGFVGASWLLKRYALRQRSLIPAADVLDFLFAIMIGVFLGGRIGWFVLYHPKMLVEDPLSFFRIWEGGMASHGGFIGVAIAIALYARKKAIPFFHVTDLIVSTAAFGLLLGRIANFINGELWGNISDVPWAVIFPESAPGIPVSEIPPRHPSQLYEAALEGLALFAYMQFRFWKSDTVLKRPGQLTAEFLFMYAVARIICEVFRQPDVGVEPIMGLSRGTFYSVFLIVAAVVVFALARRSGPVGCSSGRRPG